MSPLRIAATSTLPPRHSQRCRPSLPLLTLPIMLPSVSHRPANGKTAHLGHGMTLAFTPPPQRSRRGDKLQETIVTYGTEAAFHAAIVGIHAPPDRAMRPKTAFPHTPMETTMMYKTICLGLLEQRPECTTNSAQRPDAPADAEPAGQRAEGTARSLEAGTPATRPGSDSQIASEAMELAVKETGGSFVSRFRGGSPGFPRRSDGLPSSRRHPRKATSEAIQL